MEGRWASYALKYIKKKSTTTLKPRTAACTHTHTHHAHVHAIIICPLRFSKKVPQYAVCWFRAISRPPNSESIVSRAAQMDFYARVCKCDSIGWFSAAFTAGTQLLKQNNCVWIHKYFEMHWKAFKSIERSRHGDARSCRCSGRRAPSVR